MDRSRRFIISGIIGLISFLGIYSYILVKERNLLQMSNMVPVLVATDDIPGFMQLDETMFKQTKVPLKYLQPGALQSSQDASGQIAIVGIMKGEQITSSKIITVNAEGLSHKIMNGMRGVSIAVDEVTGVAFLVKPGDYIDILATFDFGDKAQSQKYTYTLFENLRVLAMQRNLGSDNRPGIARDKSLGKEALDKLTKALGNANMGTITYTVEVTPEQAQRLVLAQETSRLAVALRSVGETDRKLELPAVTPADLTNLKGLLKQNVPSYMEYRGGGGR